MIDPDHWQTTYVADDKGVVTAPERGIGRYLLSTMAATRSVRGTAHEMADVRVEAES